MSAAQPARVPGPDDVRERLIVGLDVASREAAERLVVALAGRVRCFKIGKQLFVRGGPDVVRMVHAHAAEVFLDLKFHDIPNTVAAAAVEAARLGVRMFNVHAAGGVTMLQETVAAVDRVCRDEGRRRPTILGVTVLTSLGTADLHRAGVAGTVGAQVVRLARLARRAGLDGVVASPREIALVRRACGPAFVVVTPGVRPPGAANDDQRRVMTPADAIAAGADFVVLSRPVLGAADPAAAVDAILHDMAAGAGRRDSTRGRERA